MHIVHCFDHYKYKCISHFLIFKLANISPCLCLIVSQILSVSCHLHIKYNFMCVTFVVICISSLDCIYINVNQKVGIKLHFYYFPKVPNSLPTSTVLCN